MKDDLVPVDELIRQDKLDRIHDEALRLAKIYVNNRLSALEYWHRNLFGRAGAAIEALLFENLGRQMRMIGKSLRKDDPMFHKIVSFADALDQIWRLPEALELLRQMHRELDPLCDTRSIVPAPREPSWRDWRYNGPIRAWD